MITTGDPIVGFVTTDASFSGNPLRKMATEAYELTGLPAEAGDLRLVVALVGEHWEVYEFETGYVTGVGGWRNTCDAMVETVNDRIWWWGTPDRLARARARRDELLGLGVA